MKEMVSLLIAVSAGAIVGAFFFSGLRWTVQRSTTVSCPGLLFAVSYMLRLATVGIVIFIFRHRAVWFLPGLLGFIIAREWLVRRFSPRENKMSKFYHAP